MKAQLAFESWAEAVPRWKVITFVFVPAYILYFLINHNPLFHPARLPMLPGEAAIPFVDWTIYIYISVLFEILFALAILPKQGFGKVASSSFLICAVCIFCFLVWPTMYPRVDYNDCTWITELIKWADPANNCFPSLHIAISAFVALAIRKNRGDLPGVVAVVWSAMIAISTLTTKQHYILDVAAGFCLALFFSRRLSSPV